MTRNEHWTYMNREVEVVNRYKYLGIMLTPNLSMIPYLEEKATATRLAIGSTYGNFLSLPHVSCTDKIKVFEAAMRSILPYAAEVWGYKQSDKVEEVLRYFVKLMFSMLRTAPSYLLSFETGLKPLFLTTLKCHFNYIRKVFRMPILGTIPSYHSG